MEHSEFVRRARTKLGLTQEALAAILGVTGISVYRWEAGIRGLPLPTKRLIESKLKEARGK